MSLYSLDDLKTAQDTLDSINTKWSNYSGNNPNKYQSELKSARRSVKLITESLKSSGLIPLTEAETLNKELDILFPKARSKQIIEHNGAKYIKKFFPAEKSNSGKTVTAWDSYWEIIKE